MILEWHLLVKVVDMLWLFLPKTHPYGGSFCISRSWHLLLFGILYIMYRLPRNVSRNDLLVMFSLK